MHILFFSHYFPPEVNAPATRTFQHARRWVAAGHQVTVVTCAPNCPSGVVFDGYRNAWRTEEVMDGIRVVRVWTVLAANRGFFWRVINYVSFMLRATLFAVALRDVDVVVATSPQFFCGWAGVLCKWLRRWPLVLEIRDIWPESIVTVGAMKRSWIIRLLEGLERWMYAAADHVVTVGDGYRQQLLCRKVPPAKISVVPNGVDTMPHADINPGAVRRRYGAEGKFICCYVGTIGLAHGLDVVLEAAQVLQEEGRHDVVFWIVGDGADRGRLEAEIQRRPLANVLTTGLVPKHEAAEIIAAADACLVHLNGTSLFSTVIPSKIFEIMLAGTPIIMGVRGEACDIVLKGHAGVAMTPDDAGSLLGCLEMIAANPGAYRGGPAEVRGAFNRDDLADRMLNLVARQCGASETAPEEARTRRAA